MPKFSPADGNRFVQIVNDGDHWMCVTNIFGTTTHEIHVFDSLQRKRLSNNALVQVSAILRNDECSHSIQVHLRKFARQRARSRACGLYATAAAFSCCNGVDPSGTDFDVNEMQREISTRILERSPDIITGYKRWEAADIAFYTTDKVFCICHRRRGRGKMIQCTWCEHWFHVDCIEDIPSQALHDTREPWYGPCCKTNVTGDEAMESVDSQPSA